MNIHKNTGLTPLGRERIFCAWARRQHLEVLPPDPQTVGLYITACASRKVTGDKKPNSVATIERRLSSLAWNYTQRGEPLDRKDRHIATVPAGIRNSHAKPSVQNEAILPEDLIAMLETVLRKTHQVAPGQSNRLVPGEDETVDHSACSTCVRATIPASMHRASARRALSNAPSL